jgi:phosphate:Na+ symporter
MHLVEVTNDLEHIGDRIATDIVTSTRKRIEARAQFQPPAIGPITRLHQEVAVALRDGVKAVVNDDDQLATDVRAMKEEVGTTIQNIMAEGVNWISADRKSGLTSYIREVEFIEILDSIFKLARRIARSQLAMRDTSDAVIVSK